MGFQVPLSWRSEDRGTGYVCRRFCPTAQRGTQQDFDEGAKRNHSAHAHAWNCVGGQGTSSHRSNANGSAGATTGDWAGQADKESEI